MNLRSLAIIIDGEVVDVLQFDERIAAMLSSQPTIVDITSHSIGTGWQFDGSNFVNVINGKTISIDPQTDI